MSDNTPLRVLICENNSLWKRTGVELRRPGGDRPIIVLPDICGTALDAIDAIADDDPDAILIDDHVPWSAGREPNFWAVRTVAEITRRYGRSRPVRILWTPRPDDLLIFAFWRFGGHNVADKDHDDPEDHAVDVLLQTAAGKYWQPPAPTTRDHEAAKFISDHIDLIAALDGGMTNKEAAEWLTQWHRKTINEASVGQYVSRLRAALGIPANERNSRDRKRDEIVAEALHQGWRWIKPVYSYFDPDRPRDQPEQQPSEA